MRQIGYSMRQIERRIEALEQREDDQTPGNGAWMTADQWQALQAGATFEALLPATMSPAARAKAIEFHYAVELPRRRQAAEAAALEAAELEAEALAGWDFETAKPPA